MSGNFIVTIFVLKMIYIPLQTLKFLLALLHSASIAVIALSIIASMSTIFYINCFVVKHFT